MTVLVVIISEEEVLSLLPMVTEMKAFRIELFLSSCEVLTILKYEPTYLTLCSVKSVLLKWETAWLWPNWTPLESTVSLTRNSSGSSAALMPCICRLADMASSSDKIVLKRLTSLFISLTVELTCASLLIDLYSLTGFVFWCLLPRGCAWKTRRTIQN